MKQRKCAKCSNHPGVYLRRGMIPEDCFPCLGTGFIKVYSKEEKERMHAAQTERSNALQLVKARAKELGGYNLEDRVRWGFDKLETNEPERLPKLYASLKNGRLDDVVNALEAYVV